MANKTVQALKISASISLNAAAREAVEKHVLMPAPLAQVACATGKLRITHALAARYDDPDYSVRVNQRIASIKEALASLGEIEAWHVTAGAVDAFEAEVLPPVEEKPVDWSNAAEVSAAIATGKLPDGWRKDGEVVVVPDEVTLGKLQRNFAPALALLAEVRNEAGVLLKSRELAAAE